MEIELFSMLKLLLDFIFSMQFIELAVKILIFPGLAYIGVFVIVIIWFERKFLARIHLRIGPLHVGPISGLFQPIADFIKLLGKEVIVPDNAHKTLYNLAPIAAVTVSCMSIAFIPFGWIAPGKNWVIYETPLNLLIILVLFTIRPFIIIGAGWASNCKYSTIGALRAAFQLLAYEVPIIISIASVVMLSGSFNLIDIVNSQSKIWFAVLQPLGLAVLFIAMMAELGRRPFDLPLAEQEIVYGWVTEYTGIQFVCFMMAEYVDLCVVSLLIALLYLGGWLGLGFLPPVAWLILKSVIVCVVIIMGRGTWPRVRIDQLLDVGWTILIPLALAQVFITMLLMLAAPWLLPWLTGLIGG
jgi:NADH-quinone oxidoreductase subunit H